MLANKVDADPVEVLGESGNTFYFRPLSGDDLDEAEAAAMREMASALGRDAAAVFGEMSTSESSAEAVKKAQEQKADEDDPLDGWSRKVLLIGLVKWEGPNYDGEKCDEKGKKQLMEPVRSWAALEVLNRSRVNAATTEGKG